MNTSRCVTAILIGAGNRGRDVYGSYALNYPQELKFVAVADPNSNRREDFANEHKIPVNFQFDSWEDLLTTNVSKIADTAFICTQDQMHAEPALKALKMGYHVLLEKPMATNLNHCLDLVKKSEENNLQLRIAHVLRYNEFFNTIHKTINAGLLGDIITIDHRENVSYFHYAHSYVRGNWAVEKESSPMILSKSCHDFDILYWLIGKPAKSVASFGTLNHFKLENLPPNAPKRCTDGCSVNNSCKYYAPRIYIEIIPLLGIAAVGGTGIIKFTANMVLNHPKIFNALKKFIPSFQKVQNYNGWPINTITNDFTLEGKRKALSEGPYGRCVYQCGNDVVDHQVTILEWNNGITATFTMHGFSPIEGRTIRIDGTEATLLGKALATGNKIILHNHFSGKKKVILKSKMNIDTSSGHGGGDYALIKSFIESIQDNIIKEILTSAKESFESHLMAFAAEESRKSGSIINLNPFREKLR